MGLFDKLFGDKKDMNEMKSAFQSVAKSVLDEAGKKMQDLSEKIPDGGSAAGGNSKPSCSPNAANIYGQGEGNAYSQDTAPAYGGGVEGPSGLSWGPEMPAEENQFNYPGTYLQYFDHVFREEFPEYQITMEQARLYDGTVCTFRKNGAVALIVELLSRRSEPKSLRRQCRQTGTPYLRYYYDYEGWWNTRSYVAERTRRALQG